ncbi:long-chain-fatty-acid--CoA ligase [Micromonospora peucetia]|uniref:Long-chain-fatty-acid--CoA ligase n=1 Tax=Micromonospora peucetia TaxID=47871 RepID=A0ABZ1EDD3_9ACTN|nr:long-chain-fatty-acid--CoA ligase [Micromonospora peucetia]MCX4390151.1 long-chain-fatty-acid--CoA ligase [Micromonospora peucetia]WSA32537.1 long-chain-fatty-acid--CoA ligase [Micromonospora peucetia]
MVTVQLRTLVDVARRHAVQQPDVVAMICEGRRVDYATLHRVSNQVARGLQAAGLRPGDRIAYLGRESEHYYDLLFGAAKTGVVLVPINWRLAAGEVEHILRDCGAALLFVDSDSAAVAEKLAPELPMLRQVVALDSGGVARAGFAAWVAAQPDANVLARVTPDTPLVQMYTSGTTGLPKGVVLAHRSLFAVRDALASADLDWLDLREGEVNLVSVPGFHIAGLGWAALGFISGVTNVVMREFTTAGAIELIRTLRVRTAILVPALLRLLLVEPGVTREDFASLRKIVYGSAPISAALLARCIEGFGCEFAQIYGLTETGNSAVCLPPADHTPDSGKMQAAGLPYPGFEVKVVDDKGNPLPAGEVGEVWLRSPGVMVEYWNQPEATAKTLVDGWVVTGDAGVLDEDGYLFIRDRIKDVIIVAAENVYPAEVENVIGRHPLVAESAVVGVPDERWGEAVYAFVVPVEGQQLTERDLALHLRGQLAGFKQPLHYEFIERVPRNPSGKILRRELRERFWQGHDRRVG